MFDLTDRKLHWIAVEWPGLSPDETDADGLSVPIKHKIELRVELVDRDEAKAIFPALFHDGEGDAPEGPEEFEVFRRLVKAWRKVVIGGKPAPFDDEHIRGLLRVPMFGPAFTSAYVLALGGQVEVREKN